MTQAALQLTRRALLGSAAGHKGAVSALSFTADGQRLLSGGSDGSLHCWSLEARGQKALLWSQTASGAVLDVCCLPADGEALVTAFYEKKLQLWDLGTGAMIKAFGAHSSYPRLSISADGTVGLSINRDGMTPFVWDLASRKKVGQLKGHKFGLDSWELSSDGKRALTVGWYDRTLRLWDVVRQREVWQVNEWEAGPVVSWAPDGKRFAAAGRELSLREARPGARAVWTVRPEEGQVGKMVFSPDGRHIFCSWRDRRLVRAFDASSGAVVAEATIEHGEPGRLCVSPDGTALAVATHLGKVVVLQTPATTR
jgi:WD40 repeat protein